MGYNVGDILWIVTNERPGLIVGQISEEIIKKTLVGENKIYTIDLARGSKTVKVNLSKIAGDIFASEDEAKSAMLKDAEEAINELINYNNESIKKHFNINEVAAAVKIDKNPDYEYIELENGQKAKVKIPKELKNARKNN